MSYESMSRHLMNYGLNGYVLNIAASGVEVLWLQSNGDSFIPWTSWNLDFDMLSGFEFLREAMQTETLVIFFNAFNMFEAELSHKKRDGGYKEPFYKEVYATVTGHSILEVLSLLNKKIESTKLTSNGTKLELVKRENI